MKNGGDYGKKYESEIKITIFNADHAGKYR